MGLTLQSQKRNRKADGKQSNIEIQSFKSGGSRSTNGRFEGKYKVGDKAADGSIIKEVREEEWKLLPEKGTPISSVFTAKRLQECSRAIGTNIVVSKFD